MCQGIKDDERGGKAIIDAVAQGSESDEFWESIGGQGPIAPAVEAPAQCRA